MCISSWLISGTHGFVNVPIALCSRGISTMRGHTTLDGQPRGARVALPCGYSSQPERIIDCILSK
jgi:hypothetical protein